MLFVFFFISRRFIEDRSSRGRMPQMKTLIALFSCLKQLGILIRLFAISLGESFSLSSDVFLKFFRFLQKKNSRLIIWTKYVKKTQKRIGFKIDIASEGLAAASTSIYPPPHTVIPPIISTCYPPTLQDLFSRIALCFKTHKYSIRVFWWSSFGILATTQFVWKLYI